MPQFLNQIDHAVRLAIRRSALAPMLRSIFRRSPLNDAIALGRRMGWDAAVDSLLSDIDQGPLGSRAFHAAIRSAINQDPDVELLLTALRRRLLLGPQATWEVQALQPTMASLIQQAMNNEYV